MKCTVPDGSTAYKATDSVCFPTFYGCPNLVLKTVRQSQDYQNVSQYQVNFTSYAHKGVIAIISMKAMSFQQWHAQKNADKLVSVAVNVLPGIMTEIRICLFKSIFYLFERYLMTVTSTTSCLVLSHFQGIDVNIGFGL